MFAVHEVICVMLLDTPSTNISKQRQALVGIISIGIGDAVGGDCAYCLVERVATTTGALRYSTTGLSLPKNVLTHNAFSFLDKKW